MATRISTTAAKAACDAIVDLVDGGSGAGYIQVRTGSQPATVATAASGTLLATHVLSDPAFGNATTASPSVATASAVGSDVSVDASGTPGWFRVFDSADTAIWDGSVTITGGGGELTFDSVTWVAGGTAAITAFTASHPTS